MEVEKSAATSEEQKEEKQVQMKETREQADVAFNADMALQISGSETLEMVEKLR